MLTVCIPTLNNYKMLEETCAIISKQVSPKSIWILDNGGKLNGDKFPGVHVVKTGKKGVAESWNWFINNTPGPWLISNDDVYYHDDAILKIPALVDFTFYGFMGMGGNLFSSFILTRSVINAVGYFDEKISPGYAYFEDNDYDRRLHLFNIPYKLLDISIEHRHSQTFNNMSNKEKQAHHQRFRLAKNNYIKKWGGSPGKESYLQPKEL